ncbi:hypothetical protein EV363DRAFT_241174 [Boletus edulis]|nr:hypothetical protein EV363DRAFT_241174 [Boletus edulis]
MSRSFCVPAIFFLFSAFVLLFIVSISLPFLTAMDITRVHYERHSRGGWRSKIRTTQSHGYSFSVQNNANNTVFIGSSWTLGLAVHPVACGVSFIALLFSFSQHITATLVASLFSFLAATLALVAFAIDIALYAYLRIKWATLVLETGPSRDQVSPCAVVVDVTAWAVQGLPRLVRKTGLFSRFRRRQ